MKTERQLWSARGRCSALEPKEATRSFMMVLLLKDLSFIPVSSKGCRLQHRDSRLPSVRYSAPTFNLLTLHHRHCKGTIIHRILELWDRATVVVKLGTMLIGVRGSKQSRLPLRIQTNRTSTAMLTTVQLPQQGRTKPVLM
jgi:hypothetical protein